MNSDKQRAAIALYCGWKVEDNEYKRWTSPNGTQWNYPPAYDKDLNAMHEAEKILTPAQWEIYSHTLLGLLGSISIGANADKRAEAFLKTIGKWEE